MLGIFIGGLVVFTKYPQVYGTVQGQVVLFILGIIVLLGLWMMRRLSVGGQPPRILSERAGADPMNPIVVGVVVAGAVFGLAVGLLVIYWLVPQRVSLHDALALDRTMLSAAVLEQEALARPGCRDAAQPVGRDHPAGWRTGSPGWRLTTPDEALALIEWTRGRFLLTRVGFTLAAVLIGPLFWLLSPRWPASQSRSLSRRGCHC